MAYSGQLGRITFGVPSTTRGRTVVIIASYCAEQHRQGIREMLRRNRWEAHYVSGQIAGIDVLAAGTLPGMRGKVYATLAENRLSGFVSVEFQEWKRLGQLHGLAVDPNLKRRGIATALCEV